MSLVFFLIPSGLFALLFDENIMIFMGVIVGLAMYLLSAINENLKIINETIKQKDIPDNFGILEEILMEIQEERGTLYDAD